jgi:hypothetical protein
MQHFIKCLFSGRLSELTYPVDAAALAHIRLNVSREPKRFCRFSTSDGRDVAVNLDHLDYVRFGWNEAERTPAMKNDGPASIYFENREEAVEWDASHGMESLFALEQLESGISAEEPYLSMTVVTGETVVFDARHVDAVEMSSALVAEGASWLDPLNKRREHSRGSEASSQR